MGLFGNKKEEETTEMMQDDDDDMPPPPNYDQDDEDSEIIIDEDGEEIDETDEEQDYEDKSEPVIYQGKKYGHNKEKPDNDPNDTKTITISEDYHIESILKLLKNKDSDHNKQEYLKSLKALIESVLFELVSQEGETDDEGTS